MGAPNGHSGLGRDFLLRCAEAAGPIYIVVGVAEALLRDGFDIRRHALSLLANGKWGWIHSLMMVGSGLLTILGAIGIRRSLSKGRGVFWGPALIGLYGLGLVGAGFSTADPALGFPPGTPMKGNPISVHGLMHFVCGGIGFAGLIAGCLVFAWRFAPEHSRWAAFSALTGLIFLAWFYGIATLSQKGDATRAAVNIGFSFAVALAWVWLSLLANSLRRSTL